MNQHLEEDFSNSLTSKVPGTIFSINFFLIEGQFWSFICNRNFGRSFVTASVWSLKWQTYQSLKKNKVESINCYWRTNLMSQINGEHMWHWWYLWMTKMGGYSIFFHLTNYAKFVAILMKGMICFWIFTGWLLSFWHSMSSLLSSVLFWHAWLALLSVVVCPASLLFSMLLRDRYE